MPVKEWFLRDRSPYETHDSFKKDKALTEQFAIGTPLNECIWDWIREWLKYYKKTRSNNYAREQLNNFEKAWPKT